MIKNKRQSAAALIRQIGEQGLRILTTADLQNLTALSPAAATQALRRLEANGLLTRIKRGVWVNRLAADLNAFEAAPHLSSPWPSYISLYSALSAHGIVEEVPQVVYAISAAPPRRWKTPIGSFHIHRLPPPLIWGYSMQGNGRAAYPLADPEKAFLDLAYLALTPRSPLELPYRREGRWPLDRLKLKAYAAKFNSKRLTGYLRKKGLI